MRSVGKFFLFCLFGLSKTVGLLDSGEASMRTVKVTNG